jgi:hypothetical protein
MAGRKSRQRGGFVKSIQHILGFIAVCLLSIAPSTLFAQNRESRIPAGTVIGVRMIDSISSDQNYAGQIFRGSLDSPIRVGDRTVLPRGAKAYMKLTDVESSGRVKGRSELKLQLERIVAGNRSYAVSSNVLVFRGKSESKKTGKSAAIGAAVGGGVGALLGGGKGAAVGAGLGAGAGVASNAMHQGEQIRIGSESLIRFRLTAPLRIGQ